MLRVHGSHLPAYHVLVKQRCDEELSEPVDGAGQCRPFDGKVVVRVLRVGIGIRIPSMVSEPLPVPAFFRVFRATKKQHVFQKVREALEAWRITPAPDSNVNRTCANNQASYKNHSCRLT